jgi:hypothetical protein
LPCRASSACLGIQLSCTSAQPWLSSLKQYPR